MKPRWRDRSINQRVPVFIALVLLITVAALSGTAYDRLRATLLSTAGVRLQLASQPVARSLEQSISQLRALLLGVTRDSAVIGALSTERLTPAATRALSRIPPDTSRPAGHVELRTAAGRRLYIDRATRGDEPTPWVDTMIARGSLKPGDVVFSPVQVIGNLLFADAIAVVRAPGDSTRPLGYLIQHAPLVGRGVSAIRDLIGSGTTVIVGMPGSGVWTDLSQRAAAPPPGIRAGRAMVFASSARGPGVGVATPIRGTPWLLWVQQPWTTALQPMAGFARTLAALAVFFVVAGTVVAWWLSRRITKPLVTLTRAAEAIAVSGAVSARDDTGDEVQRLSSAFTRMEERVAQSHAELEVRVEQRTRELGDALAQLREAHDKLVQQERLAMLGRLAGAVGHELRNPLGVMTNALFVLESAITAPPIATEYLGILRGQVGIAERIVGDLLDTARTRPPQLGAVPLDGLADAQLQRLGPLPAGVVVERRFPSDLPPAWADESQISQIVLNLLSNAVQAMGEQGGTLTLVGRCTEPGRVALDVCDTGPGVAADLLERIFEPLFTTKARGLGLGLWVSRTLAETNGGALRVRSDVGAGATFTLELPAVQKEAA